MAKERFAALSRHSTAEYYLLSCRISSTRYLSGYSVCCSHQAANEASYRRMCLCCHLLGKLWLSPQDLPTSKQPRLFYLPHPVLIFSQEIIGRKKQTEWVVRTCGLGRASFAVVLGEDWNCKKPCLACFAAVAANISLSRPWNFFQHASFAFFW